METALGQEKEDKGYNFKLGDISAGVGLAFAGALCGSSLYEYGISASLKVDFTALPLSVSDVSEGVIVWIPLFLVMSIMAFCVFVFTLPIFIFIKASIKNIVPEKLKPFFSDPTQSPIFNLGAVVFIFTLIIGFFTKDIKPYVNLIIVYSVLMLSDEFISKKNKMVSYSIALVVTAGLLSYLAGWQSVMNVRFHEDSLVTLQNGNILRAKIVQNLERGAIVVVGSNVLFVPAAEMKYIHFGSSESSPTTKLGK